MNLRLILFNRAAAGFSSCFCLSAVPHAHDPRRREIGEPARPGRAGAAGDPAAFTGCTRVNVAAQNAAYEQQVVELVNQRSAKRSACRRSSATPTWIMPRATIPKICRTMIIST